jgi:tetratricopeptide (TPR) repeat protein
MPFRLLIMWMLIAVPTASFGSVFIQTIPMRAEVFTNGVRLGISPLLIERNPSTPLTFSFRKEGYYPVEFTVNLTGEITNLITPLAPVAVSIAFPDRDNIDYNGKNYRSSSIQNLAAGTYEIFPNTNSVAVRRVNPDKQFVWFGAGAAVLGLGVGITSQLLANNFYSDFLKATSVNGALRGMNLAMFCDNLATIAYGFGAVGFTVGSCFFIEDLVYQSKNTAIVLHDSEDTVSDRALYEKAMDYQSQLDTTNSFELFNRIVSQYPESQYYPISLFRRAKIFSMRGDNDHAIADLEKLQKDYPVYDLYELILKDLGDLYLARGDDDSAADCYRAMRLAPRYYQPWESDVFLFYAQAAKAKKTGAEEDRKIAETSANQLLSDTRIPEDRRKEIQALLPH